MFLPIRTDGPQRLTPYVNYGLVALNVLVFVLTDVIGGTNGSLGESLKHRFDLDPGQLELTQFFTYQFLHGDLMHLLGNMWFLWLFGNSVNSKMGHLPYLLFYLAAGVFSGMGFVSTASLLDTCIGASGAIAGVTTAYLVLFPHSRVTVLYWFWLIGVWHIRALYVIVLKIIVYDNILMPSLSGGGGAVQVAYSAHLAGYLFGFSVCMLLLLIRALPRDQYDILALIKRSYQRQQFKAAMADPNAQARATYGRVARPVATRTGRPVVVPTNPADEALIRIRAEVSELVAKGDYTTAADRYETLVSRDPDQCLPRRSMLAVANQLMTLGRYPQAAAAYEKHLKVYPTGSDTLQIKFMLGLIYAKYLEQHEEAEGLLKECADHLTDPQQKEQAAQWLGTVLAALGRSPSTEGA